MRYNYFKSKGNEKINMKKMLVSYVLLIFAFSLSACTGKGKLNDNEVTQELKNGEDAIASDKECEDNYISEYDNMSAYSGVWTTNGYAANSVYTKTGGSVLSVNIEGNHVVGSYVCIQGTSFRIASIDNIDANIVSNVAEVFFKDDGWGNEGLIKLIFEEDQITIKIADLIANPDNVTGMSVSASVLIRDEVREVIVDDNNEKDSIEQRILDTESYRKETIYWSEVTAWDEKNTRTGMDRPIEPLLYAEMLNYSKEELEQYPKIILYLAKNEIYAKHGYIFSDMDLQNYFMGQVWYKPEKTSAEFNDSVFNEYERDNLNLLLELINN